MNSTVHLYEREREKERELCLYLQMKTQGGAQVSCSIPLILYSLRWLMTEPESKYWLSVPRDPVSDLCRTKVIGWTALVTTEILPQPPVCSILIFL